MSSEPVQVFLVDDERDVTDGLTWLLDSVKIRSRAFSNAEDFLAEVRKTTGPACAVLDLRMAETSGLALQQRMLAEGLQLPLIFLSAHGDVPAAVSAIRQGAVDFLEKPFKPQAFLDAINRLMRIARERYAQRAQENNFKGSLKKLSAREAEVLGCLIEGRTSKETARILQISPKTVDVHRASIMRKMMMTSVGELQRLIGGLHGPKP
jgi:FixJ family two-component response regulator